MTQPVVYMIAGPNGAGKTTAAMKLLPNFLSIHEFINADEIARGLSPFDPDRQKILAGRLMLSRIDALIASGKSFAFETTASSHVLAKKIKAAKAAGYETGLIYLWLPNADFAKQRVRLRIAQGGHAIPDMDVERRYKRSLYNIVNVYFSLMDMAVLIDSTAPALGEEQAIATKRDNQDWVVIQPAIWDDIHRVSMEPGDE